METKPIIRKLRIGLYVIFAILLVVIIVSWFVDYPKWLDQLLGNVIMVGLGLVLLIKGFQIGGKNRKYSSIYMISGVLLIIVAFLNLTFVKIVAVVGLVAYLLTNQKVQKIINNKEKIHES